MCPLSNSFPLDPSEAETIEGKQKLVRVLSRKQRRFVGCSVCIGYPWPRRRGAPAIPPTRCARGPRPLGEEVLRDEVKFAQVLHAAGS